MTNSNNEMAQRRFVTDSEEQQVRVRLMQPTPGRDKGSFLCRYTIETDKETFEHEAWGVDTLQALLMALKMLAADLEAVRDHDYGGRLKWEFSRTVGDLGLPSGL